MEIFQQPRTKGLSITSGKFLNEKSFEIFKKESFWRDSVYLQETEIEFLGKNFVVKQSSLN